MQRPDFSELKNGAEFKAWYWLKEEMTAICRDAKIATGGSKFQMRDRIAAHLDNNIDMSFFQNQPAKPHSTFDWVHTALSLDTIITDNVSFGPNFRNFLKSHIGKRFVCHSDFMDWVKAHPAKTLEAAIYQWEELENRKNNPGFKRTIAEHNMLAQYVRDFLAGQPQLSFKDALSSWNKKKAVTDDRRLSKIWSFRPPVVIFANQSRLMDVKDYSFRKIRRLLFLRFPPALSVL